MKNFLLSGRYWVYWMIGILMGSVLLFSACTGTWVPQEVVLTQTQLQNLVQRKFPLNKNLSNPIVRVDARLSQPQLSLDEQAQRVRLTVQVNMMIDVDSLTRVGKMVASGQVGYDPVRHALMLRAPVLEQFEMEGVPPGVLPILGKIWLHEATEMALYTLNDDQIKQIGEQLDKVSVTILSDRVVIKR